MLNSNVGGSPGRRSGNPGAEQDASNAARSDKSTNLMESKRFPAIGPARKLKPGGLPPPVSDRRSARAQFGDRLLIFAMRCDCTVRIQVRSS
jgi:hypothetical protein